MKKISILSMMISAIVFGLFTITIDSKGQDKEGQATPIAENQEAINETNLKISVGDFSCMNCFYDDEDLIGYGVKFKKDGVSVNVQLITLNTSTGKFNAGYVKGVFSSNKVEVSADRKWIDKRPLAFTADDNVTISKDRIILKGNATITSPQNELIEADEIIIL